MQRATIGAAHAGGGTPLHLHRLAQGLPTVIDFCLRLELGANQLHTLVRQHRNEQMPVRAILLVVKHRAQTQLTLEAAKHTLNIGQTRIGLPQLFCVPAPWAGFGIAGVGPGRINLASQQLSADTIHIPKEPNSV